MNLQTHKLSLIEMLLGVNDVKLLLRVEAILKADADEKDIVPMTMEEYHVEIDHALEDVREGRTISQSEMKKRIDKWH